MATATIMSEERETVIVSEGKFETHPESYYPRVFVYVRENLTWYELLRTGQAIPWKESPEGRGFDFWIVDTDYSHDFGVYRTSHNTRS